MDSSSSVRIGSDSSSSVRIGSDHYICGSDRIQRESVHVDLNDIDFSQGIILIICFVFGLNTDRDGDTDDGGCEEIADEKNDSCVSCVNLLDEIKGVEENFSVKMNELEERHQQQLIDLRMSHNAELNALKRENAELKKEKEENEKQVVT